ncbi:FG-GAP-like repeat-containing protein [Planctomycetota bacterium]
MTAIENLERRDLLSAVGFAVHPAEPVACCGRLLADINGDGTNDWVWGDSTLRWSPNQGDATFGDPVFIGKTRDSTQQMASADMDGDDDLDLVRLTGESLTWYENRDGNGRFGPANEIVLTNENIRSFTIGDLNGDRLPEVLVTEIRNGRSRLLWLNNGEDQQFEQKEIFDLYGDARVVDFDQDGDADILAVKTESKELFWLENVAGDFRNQIAIASFVPQYDIGDINGDGHLDIVSHGGTSFAIHVNNGEGSLTPIVFSPTDSWLPEKIFLADFDNDGDLDIFREVSGPDHKNVALHENIDGSTFVARNLRHLFDDYSRTDAYLGDIDGDGADDLLGEGFWFRYDSNTDQFTRRLLVGESQPDFFSQHLVDLNGDGKDELLYSAPCRSRYVRCDSHLYWLEVKQDFTPNGTTNAIITDGQFPLLFEPGDFDGDGDNDLVVLSVSHLFDAFQERLYWLENIDGAGTYSEPQTIFESALPDYPRVIDLVGDGIHEIAIEIRGNKTGILRLDGGSFVTEELNISDVNSITPVDLNGDGLRDLLVATQNGVFTVINSPSGYSEPTTIFHEQDKPISIEFVDMNGDGLLDIALSKGYSADENARASWMENLGGGRFGDRHPIPTASGMQLITSADFDSDGAVDLVFREFDDEQGYKMNVAYNNGLGDFQMANLAQIWAISEIRDVDGDGDPDVIDHDLTWYENRPVGDANGDRRFDSSDLVKVFQAAEYEDDVPGNSTFQEGDWNGDGDFDSSDLVVAMQNGSYSDAARPKKTLAAFDGLFRDKKKSIGAFRP